MFSRRLKQAYRSIAFRLTLWLCVLFGMISVVMFSITYVLLAAHLKSYDHAAIRSELAEAVAQYEFGGLDALRQEVTIANENDVLHRVVSPDHEVRFLRLPKDVLSPLAGNSRSIKARFVRLPKDMPQVEIPDDVNLPEDGGEAWTVVPFDAEGHALEVASVRLSDGSLLQVGMSNAEREEFLKHIRHIFVGVLIPVSLLGFCGGAYFAFRAFRPIRHLIRTVRAIVTGDTSARVPLVRTRDELEELVTLFNGMLERNGSLINGMRGTLDNVAHDLRTPVTRLRGVAEMAVQSEGDTASLREALLDCVEEAEQIRTMLNTLMDISEAETGMLRLEMQDVDMSLLISQTIDLYKDIAEDNGVAIQAASHGDLHLRADPNRLRQVLANLLDNAVKYTPEGGRVEIEARQEGGQVMVRIADTGIGIPADELPSIWDRLYRVDKSRSTRGLGLGLSVVKAVVQAHHGRVEAVSGPDAGSMFTVFLPVSQPDEQV